jgi:hypothetical protein
MPSVAMSEGYLKVRNQRAVDHPGRNANGKQHHNHPPGVAGIIVDQQRSANDRQGHNRPYGQIKAARHDDKELPGRQNHQWCSPAQQIENAGRL